MARLAALLVLSGTFASGTGCVWAAREPPRYRYHEEARERNRPYAPEDSYYYSHREHHRGDHDADDDHDRD